MGVSSGRGGGGGGAGGRDALTLVHSPAVDPAVERLGSVSGQIRGTVALDISNLTPFQAISAGTLEIGSETVTGIDLSSVTTINAVIVAINAAIAAHGSLSTYSMSLPYVGGVFYGGVIRTDGDVPTIGGTIEPLFGLAAPATTVAHEPASPFIVLPERAGGGEWSHLMIRAVGQSYRTQYWYFQGDFWSVDAGLLTNYLAFNNSGGWNTESVAAPSGPIRVGVVEAYNAGYFEVLYDQDTRTVSWNPLRIQPSQTTWRPSIDTLTVLGR